MSFNPDPTKQGQEVIFSRKTTKKIHPEIFFNNIPVSKADSPKYLSLHLDSKLSFDIHIKTVLTKVNRIMALLRQFQQVLHRPSLITICKAFKFLLIPSIRYYDVQYNAAPAITGTIRGTSKEKRYQELGFESLQSIIWFQKLSLFYKIIKNKLPSYLYHLIPKLFTSYSTRNSENLSPIKANHSFFKNPFFPSTIIEWNKLDSTICCSSS